MTISGYIRAALIAVGLVAMCAPPAHGETPAWATEVAPQGLAPLGPDGQVALALAQRHWGGPPPGCASIASFEAPLILSGDTSDPVASGRATMPTPGAPPIPCLLLVTSSDFVSMCEHITHEYGHLMGLDHSADRRDIMFAGAGKRAGLHITAPRCYGENMRREAVEELAEQRAWCRYLKRSIAPRRQRVQCWLSVSRIRERREAGATLAWD